MTKYVLVSQGIKIAESYDERWANDYANIRNKDLDEYNVKCVENGEPPIDNYIHVYTEEMDLLNLGLIDKDNKEVMLGDIIEISNKPDIYYADEEEAFIGKVVFCCGCYGIGSDNTIPDFFYGRNDNFLTFYELYDKLNLCEFEDLSYYIRIIERGNDKC